MEREQGDAIVNHDIIVLGASAGGVDALTRLFRRLPRNIPAAFLVVQHITPSARSVLPQLLDKAGPLPAAHAADGEPIVNGHIYIAPPDFHLLVGQQDRMLRVRQGPQENRSRPAIDPLFRSAAVAFGPRVVGAVLSGMLDDGTAGLVAVKACGGISIVQDPEDAAWPDMPRNALRGDTPDYCVPIADMGALFTRLANMPAGPAVEAPKRLRAEVVISEQEFTVIPDEATLIGKPSRLSCPQCGGVLNEIHEGKTVRFRCQIGHAYGPESLAAAQSDALEEALAAAVRTHHDRQILFRRMEQDARSRGLEHSATRWKNAAENAEHSAEVISKAAAVLRRPAAPFPGSRARDAKSDPASRSPTTTAEAD